MARKLISTKGLPREQWLSLRRQSIGGSDAATVMGLNPYGSLYALWADKKGLLPDKKDSEAMRQGRDFEDYVARRWEEAAGKKVRRTNFMYLHDGCDFISANVDREVVGENAGLECKTTSVYNKSDFDSGEIPLTYYCQCQHYMSVMGYDRMYLAVLVLNKGFFHFTIERDNGEIEALMKREKEFWDKYITGDEIPEMDGSEATGQALEEIYPKSTAGTAIDLTDAEETLNKYLEIKDTIADCKKLEEQYKQELQVRLGDNEKGLFTAHSVTWKSQAANRLDSARLKKERPEIYNEYVKTSYSRVFRVSERRA